MSICAQVVGKQRPRRCCCLRAQAASKSISNWGNVFVPECDRWKMERDTKFPPPGSAASKTKSPARGTKQGPWIFLPELPTLVFSLLTCSSRLPHGSSSCSCTSSEGASLLLPQSPASTAHTGHWTSKRCLEASSEAMGMHYRERHVRRGIKKKNIRAMLSFLYPQSLK